VACPFHRRRPVFTSFGFAVDIPVRIIGDTALVVGTQEQTGTHQGELVDGQFRSTVVLIRDPSWLIAGMHLSLRRPP
jgi:ketosteroid isomerase-like protein